MDATYTIREYSGEELDALVTLVHDVIDAVYPKWYPPEAVRYFHEHHGRERMHEETAGEFVLVAERDGRFIGTAALEHDLVKRVFVEPHAQGGGVGKALVEGIEAEARRRGITRLRLTSSLGAYEFWRKCGYVMDVYKAHPCERGEFLAYFEMGKAVG